jgi:hypothetical protein
MAIMVTNRKYGSLGISVAFSAALYILGFTSFFFVLPMLIFYAQSGQRDQTLISLLALLVAVLIYEIVPFKGDFSDSTSVGLLSIGLFLPIVLIGCSMIWVLLSSYRLLVRYIASCSFIAFVMLVLGLYFKSNPQVSSSMDTAMISIIDTLMADAGLIEMDAKLLGGISSQDLYSLIKEVMLVMILPLSAIAFGFSAFMSISTPRVIGDDRFDKRVASWKLPEEMVWVFLVSFLIVLLNLVIDFNTTLRVVVWNLALFIGVLYTIQGLAIMLYKLNAKTHKIGAVKLFVLAALLTILLQGLNIVIVLGLPIFGVTETWFTYRK